MNLRSRVEIIDLDVKTDNPPVGIIVKMWLKYPGTWMEQEWAEVKFDMNLIDRENRYDPIGVPNLTVKTSRLKEVDNG